MDDVRAYLARWWSDSSECIPRLVHELPEEFRTTRIWRQIKYVENYSMRIKPVFVEMQSESDMDALMQHLREVFSGEEDRLNKWKYALDNLQGLMLWIPTFSRARDYLLSAFPLGMEHPDTLRQSLVRSIRDPYPFLEAGTRARFNESFMEFKKEYIENYISLHETMRNVIRDVKKEESKVDHVALRNLELLSRLQYSDKSYLNRVNILANWIKHNQCTLPVSDIMERYPRCYCNFNPSTIQQPAGLASQINEIVDEGIQYFRSILGKCRTKIESEVKSRDLDMNISVQIGSFLEDESMTPLKEQTIEGVNIIARKNPTYFYSKIVPDLKTTERKKTKN